jgi:hypothetical protein
VRKDGTRLQDFSGNRVRPAGKVYYLDCDGIRKGL